VTLALAICCRDGIVFAADSQSTLSTVGQPTKQDTQKLYVLADRIAWAGSGSVGSIQRVEPELVERAAEIVVAFSKGHEEGARAIFTRVNALQKRVASEVLGDASTGASAYLFGGHGVAGQFLLEITADGVRQWCERSGFTAIGSGDIFAVHAYRSVSHYELPKLSLVQAQALAYRTVENAIATAAYGLGGDIRLSVATASGAHMLSETDIRAVQDIVDIWKQREVDILEELVTEAPHIVEDFAEPPSESDGVAQLGH
jgi:20S proteasome alpha/beta subunit